MKPRHLFWLMLLLMLAWLGGFVWFLRAGFNTAPEAEVTDAIVVLTGGAERVETGFRLLGEDLAPRLFISGVNPDTRLIDLARGAGIDAARFAGRVELGHAAASTRGNAAEIAAWAKPHDIASIRLVTAGYHMPRAMREVQRAMPMVRLLPHPVTPANLKEEGAFWRPRIWGLILGEYMKFLAAEVGLSGYSGGRRI